MDVKFEERWIEVCQELGQLMRQIPTDSSKMITNGVEVIQSTLFPPQQLYCHPFAFGRLISGALDIRSGSQPDPLSEWEQQLVGSLPEEK
jgi:hypothetical protein